MQPIFRIVADGHRAGAMIGTIRANFRSEVGETTSFQVNELVQDALHIPEWCDVLTHGYLLQLVCWRM